jgi:hypothetical protein
MTEAQQFPQGTLGSVVGWGTMLQAWWPLVRFLIRSLGFSIDPNPSSRTMALGWTQPLTEMSKGRPAHKTDNYTAICESIV